MSTAVERAAGSGRPRTTALLAGQLRYATVDLWRSRVVLIFTLALPLVWLLVVGALAGNATLDKATGLRVMQYATPSAIAMGVLYAAYPTVAISLAEARERGVLKRLRGTPLPVGAYLAGRIGGAVVFALGSVAAALGVGVVGFDVRIVWHTVLATAVTLLLGMACFAALGLAVAALAPTRVFASAAAVGSAVLLAFVSGLYNVGGPLPGWLERIADALPLKPFAELLHGQFDPFAVGAGWQWGRLGIVAGWALAGALVAGRYLRAERPGRAVSGVRRPRRRFLQRTDGDGRPADGDGRPAGDEGRSAGRPPAAPTLVLGQAWVAVRSAWRDGGPVFFAVILPVAIYLLVVGTQRGDPAAVDGVPLAVFFAAGTIVWGAGVAAFMNLPEAVVTDRDRGVLKRLRGTPLRPWQYLAGRTAAALLLTGVIAVLVLAIGAGFFAVRISAAGLALGSVVLVVGTLTLAACGFALAAAVPNARAVGAVGLIVLLPLAFFSDMFVVGGPEWMRTVGAFFPLRHLQNAVVLAFAPSGPTVGWGHLGVLLAWAVGTGALAIRFFRWDVRGDG